MLKRIFIIFGLMVALAAPASAADSTVPAMTAASALGGTEVLYCVQGGLDRKCTPAQVATYVLGTVSGDCTVTLGVITCTKTNGTAFSGLATLAGAAAGDVAYFNGSSWTKLTGNSSGTNCFQENSSGVPSWAACGGGGGSGTVNPGTAGQLGYYSGTGTTISGLTVGNTLKITSGTIDTAATVLTGSQTISAAQWAAGDTVRITTAAQTITLPAASTLATNGGLVIQTFGQSVTVTPNGTDNINGVNANLTVPAGKTVLATTDGSSNIWIPLDGGSIIGAPVTGSCTSGNNLYNNSGVVGCQANGGGGGTVTTTGSPASGNLAKFSAASSITNGDLSGDCTTSGTLAVTCLKTNGSAFVASATTDTTNASNISSGTLNIARLPTGLVASIPVSWDSNTTVANATVPIANPQWSSGGTITSVTYYTNGSSSPSFTAAVKIGGTNVTSCSSLTVNSSTATTTNCTAANTFTNSSQITLVISGVSGTPNQALVQINYTHGAN